MKKLADRMPDVGRKMEYFLNTGNLVSKSGLDLSQSSGFTVVAEKLNFFRSRPATSRPVQHALQAGLCWFETAAATAGLLLAGYPSMDMSPVILGPEHEGGAGHHVSPSCAGRYLSHFRSVHRGAYFAQLRTTAVRKLLPESWGFMCPVRCAIPSEMVARTPGQLHPAAHGPAPLQCDTAAMIEVSVAYVTCANP